MSELSEMRRQKALDTGVADHALNPAEVDVVEEVKRLSGGSGADVAFECSSVNVVLDTLFDAIRPGGVIVVVAIWGHPATARSAEAGAQGGRHARHHRLHGQPSRRDQARCRTARSI